MQIEWNEKHWKMKGKGFPWMSINHLKYSKSEVYAWQKHSVWLNTKIDASVYLGCDILFIDWLCSFTVIQRYMCTTFYWIHFVLPSLLLFWGSSIWFLVIFLYIILLLVKGDGRLRIFFSQWIASFFKEEEEMLDVYVSFKWRNCFYLKIKGIKKISHFVIWYRLSRMCRENKGPNKLHNYKPSVYWTHMIRMTDAAHSRTR